MTTERLTYAPASGSAFPIVLLAAFAIIAAALAIAPATRADWLLENVLVVVALVLVVWGYRHIRLSNAAYGLLFVFGVLHEIGSHYQYADVPYDDWFKALSDGQSLDALLGFQRNQFDRLVHFLYGVLVTPAIAEVIFARVVLHGFWRFVLPATFVFSHGMIYELLEWLAASVFGGDLGEAYLGTQGDSWDAHKDMALAALGTLLVLPIWLWRLRRSPARPVPD